MIEELKTLSRFANNVLEGRKHLASNLSIYDDIILAPPYDFLVDNASREIILESGVSRGDPPQYPALKSFGKHDIQSVKADVFHEEIFFLPYSISIERHFGHFLTETLGWSEPFTDSSSLLSCLSHVPVFIKTYDHSGYSETMKYLLELNHPFKTTFLHHNDIPVISAKRAYIFSPSLRIRNYISPRHLDVCKQSLAVLAPKIASLQSNEYSDLQPKTYISRSKLPAIHRHVLGETVIEEDLSARGWTIFHPELHSLEDQLIQYLSSSTIAGELGSAFHSLMLIPNHLLSPDLKLLALTRADAEINRTFIHQFCLQKLRAGFLPCLTSIPTPIRKKRSRDDIQLSIDPLDVSRLVDDWSNS